LVNSRKIVYELGRNIFDMQQVAKKDTISGPREPESKIDDRPPAPIVPSIPVTFYGSVKKQGDQKKVFLQNGERVFIATLGSIIDRRYRVLQIEANSVLLEDMLMNNRQTIFLTTR